MNNGRRTTVFTIDDQYQKQMRKKIESMLAKSENYWNKLLVEHKELLNTSLNVQIVIKQESEVETPYEFLAESFLDDEGPEFMSSRIIVNTADPSYLCYSFGYEDRRKINLSMLHNCLLNNSEAEYVEKSISLDSSAFEETNFPKLEKKEEKKEEKKGKKIFRIKGDFFEGQEAVDRFNLAGNKYPDIDPDRLICIYIENKYFFIYFESNEIAYEWTVAFKILLKSQEFSYRGCKDECPLERRGYMREFAKNKELRLEKRDKKYIVYITDIEPDAKLFREFKVFFYSRDEEEKEFFIVIDLRKNIISIEDSYSNAIKHEDYLNKLIFTQFFELVSCLIFFTKMKNAINLKSELDVQTFEREKVERVEKLEKADKIEEETEEKKKNSDSKTNKFEKKPEKIDSEEDKNKLRFLDTFSLNFWDQRRRIIKYYKRLDENRKQIVAENQQEKKKKPPKKSVQSPLYRVVIGKLNFVQKELKSSRIVYEDIKSSYDECPTNTILKAFKVLFMQKHCLREQIYLCLKDKMKDRKKKGGKRAKRKLEYEHKRHERKVNTTTTSVLKLMMFEETRPDLLPLNIKEKIDKANDKERNECCLIF